MIGVSQERTHVLGVSQERTHALGVSHERTRCLFQAVKSVEVGDNTKAIDNWITSLNELHRNRPPPNVHYTK